MTAEIVDSLLRQRAVVFGSLPPRGRDLDLLLPGAEVKDLGMRLADAGFHRRGGTWALFAHCSAYGVDVHDVSRWAPTQRAASDLFQQAVPIAGYTHLVAPAEHHRILILGLRHHRGMPLTEHKRAILHGFDDDTWQRAEQESGEWGLTSHLHTVRAELDAPAPPTQPGRTDPRRRAPWRRTVVIALSGVDGSGKSTQVRNVQAALDRLGQPAEVQWTKITQDGLSQRVGRAVKAVIARTPLAARVDPAQLAAPAREGDDGEIRNYPDGAPPPPDPGKVLRRKSKVLTWCWALLVAVGNGLEHRRAVQRHGTRVVICDRYVLDSFAHLKYRYGSAGSLWLHRRVIGLLSVRPAQAFFLDVPAEIARARKPEQYLTSELARFRELYHEYAQEAGVHVLDGTRPVDELAAEIARMSWDSLSGRLPRLRRLIRRIRS